MVGLMASFSAQDPAVVASAKSQSDAFLGGSTAVSLDVRAAALAIAVKQDLSRRYPVAPHPSLGQGL